MFGELVTEVTGRAFEPQVLGRGRLPVSDREGLRRARGRRRVLLHPRLVVPHLIHVVGHVLQSLLEVELRGVWPEPDLTDRHVLRLDLGIEAKPYGVIRVGFLAGI